MFGFGYLLKNSEMGYQFKSYPVPIEFKNTFHKNFTEMEVYRVIRKVKDININLIFDIKPDSRLINSRNQMKTWEKCEKMTI